MAAIHIVTDKSEAGVFSLDVRANTENLKFPRELLTPDSVQDVIEIFVKILHLKGVHDARYARLLLTKEALHAKLLFHHGATVHPDMLPIFERATKSIASTMRLQPQHREVLKAQLETLFAESSARGRKPTKPSSGGGASTRSKSRDSAESEGDDRSSLVEKIEAMLASGSSEKDIASLLEKAVSGRTGNVSSTASADTRMFMLLSPALSKPQSTTKMVAIEEALNDESRKVLRQMKEAYKILTSIMEQYIEQAASAAQSRAHSMAMQEVLSRYQNYKRGNAPDVDVKLGDEFLSAVNVKLNVPYMVFLMDKFLSAQNRARNFDLLHHLNNNLYEFKVKPVETLQLDTERQFIIQRRAPSISEIKEKLKDARADLAVAQGYHVDEAMRVASDKQLVSLLRRALSETKDSYPRLHASYLGAEKIVKNKRIEAAATGDDDKEALGAADGDGATDDFDDKLKLKDYVSYATACFDENPHIADTVKIVKGKPKRAEKVDEDAEDELTFGAIGSSEDEAAERPNKQKHCFFFKKGTCTQGAKCRFLHAADAAPVKVVHAGKSGKGMRDQANTQEQQKPSGKGSKGGKGKVVQQEVVAIKTVVTKETTAKKDGGIYKTYEKGCFICGDPDHHWKDAKFHDDADRKARLDLLRKQHKHKSNGAAAAGDNNSDE